jgi:hypothetical protein
LAWWACREQIQIAGLECQRFHYRQRAEAADVPLPNRGLAVVEPIRTGCEFGDFNRAKNPETGLVQT